MSITTQHPETLSLGQSVVGTLTADYARFKISPWADVTAYGAVGDGVTDDTTAIQNAINAGTTVFFPKPSVSYKCTQITPANQDQEFLGECGTILDMGSTASSFLIISHNHLYRFHGISFYAADGASQIFAEATACSSASLVLVDCYVGTNSVGVASKGYAKIIKIDAGQALSVVMVNTNCHVRANAASLAWTGGNNNSWLEMDNAAIIDQGSVGYGGIDSSINLVMKRYSILGNLGGVTCSTLSRISMSEFQGNGTVTFDSVGGGFTQTSGCIVYGDAIVKCTDSTFDLTIYSTTAKTRLLELQSGAARNVFTGAINGSAVTSELIKVASASGNSFRLTLVGPGLGGAVPLFRETGTSDYNALVGCALLGTAGTDTILAGSNSRIDRHFANVGDPTGVKTSLGTSAAATRPLDVYGSTVADGDLRAILGLVNSGDAYNASPKVSIDFTMKYTSGGAYAGLGGITIGKENTTDADTAGFLALHTRAAGSSITEAVRITSGGRVGVGTSTPVANEAFSRFTVSVTDNTASLVSFENAGTGQNGLVIRRTGGTTSRWYIYEPSGSTDLRINDISTGDTWTFLRAGGLTSAGNFRFSHGTSALATSATEGFFHLQSCAGAPIGTPASIPTGQVPMVWDSSNLQLYIYTGGAWKKSAVFT